MRPLLMLAVVQVIDLFSLPLIALLARSMLMNVCTRRP